MKKSKRKFKTKVVPGVLSERSIVLEADPKIRASFEVYIKMEGGYYQKPMTGTLAQKSYTKW